MSPRLRGAAPLQFQWTVTLVFTAGSCAHAGSRTTSHSAISGTTALSPATSPATVSTTSQFTIPFTQIRGGDLTVSVSVAVAGATLTASSAGLTVVGTNPNLGSLQSAAAQANEAFRKLTRLESGLRQFRTPGCPLFSGDNLGGVGLCQLTSPAPTDDQVWSWRANLAGGVALWNSKEATARGFPNGVRTSAAFTALVAGLQRPARRHGRGPAAQAAGNARAGHALPSPLRFPITRPTNCSARRSAVSSPQNIDGGATALNFE